MKNILDSFNLLSKYCMFCQVFHTLLGLVNGIQLLLMSLITPADMLGRPNKELCVCCIEKTVYFTFRYK